MRSRGGLPYVCGIVVSGIRCRTTLVVVSTIFILKTASGKNNPSTGTKFYIAPDSRVVVNCSNQFSG